MASLLDEIARLFGAAWVRGNVLARIVIAILLIWPLILVGTALLLTPSNALTIVPIVTIACLLVILLGSKLAIVELGFSRFIARVIVPYLLIGLYCSFVPLSESSRLVPSVALIWYLILFLFLGGRTGWGWLAAVSLIGYSVAFFPGTMQTIRGLASTNHEKRIILATTTDSDLAKTIEARLSSDPLVNGSKLTVQVNNRIATLTGSVPSNAARYEVFKVAADTAGVSKVDDRMVVKPPQQPNSYNQQQQTASLHPQSIQLLLSQWTDSLRNHDLDGHMECYAPVLEHYFRVANVSRDAVRADEARALSRFSSLQVNLTNVRVTPESQDRAMVDFEKTWDFESVGAKPFRGEDEERLEVVKSANGWAIASEVELQQAQVPVIQASAVADTVRLGQQVSIQWNAQNAAWVVLLYRGQQASLAPSGQYAIQPSQVGPGEAELIAIARNGQRATTHVIFQVLPRSRMTVMVLNPLIRASNVIPQEVVALLTRRLMGQGYEVLSKPYFVNSAEAAERLPVASRPDFVVQVNLQAIPDSAKQSTSNRIVGMLVRNLPVLYDVTVDCSATIKLTRLSDEQIVAQGLSSKSLKRNGVQTAQYNLTVSELSQQGLQDVLQNAMNQLPAQSRLKR